MLSLEFLPCKDGRSIWRFDKKNKTVKIYTRALMEKIVDDIYHALHQKYIPDAHVGEVDCCVQGSDGMPQLVDEVHPKSPQNIHKMSSIQETTLVIFNDMKKYVWSKICPKYLVSPVHKSDDFLFMVEDALAKIVFPWFPERSNRSWKALFEDYVFPLSLDHFPRSCDMWHKANYLKDFHCILKRLIGNCDDFGNLSCDAQELIESLRGYFDLLELFPIHSGRQKMWCYKATKKIRGRLQKRPKKACWFLQKELSIDFLPGSLITSKNLRDNKVASKPPKVEVKDAAPPPKHQKVLKSKRAH
jgi:hypothetical protein